MSLLILLIKGSLYDRYVACRIIFYIFYPLFSFFSIAGLIAVIGFVVYTYLFNNGRFDSLVVYGMIGGGVVSVVSVVIYFLMSAVEWDRYAKVKMGKDVQYVYNLCQKLKNTKAVMRMHIECYHYRTVRTGSGKNRKTRRKKVVTFRTNKKLKYKSWIDVSEFPNFNQIRRNLIHVFVEMEFEYADEETKRKMEKKKKSFLDKHKNKDTYHTFWIESKIGDVSSRKETDWTFAKNGKVPAIFNPAVFFISLATCLGAPYRFIFDMAFKSVKFRIKKKISRNKHKFPNKTKDKYKTDFADFKDFTMYQKTYFDDPEDQFAPIQMVTDVSQMDWTFSQSVTYQQNQMDMQTVPVQSQMSVPNQQPQMMMQQQPQMMMQQPQMMIQPQQPQMMEMNNFPQQYQMSQQVPQQVEVNSKNQTFSPIPLEDIQASVPNHQEIEFETKNQV